MIYSDAHPYNCKGDGTLAGSANLKKFVLDGKGQQAHLVSGSYIAPQGGLVLPGGITLTGEGKENTSITTHPLTMENDVLFQNQNFVFDSARIDKGIRLERMSCFGLPAKESQNAMFAFVGVEGISFTDCSLSVWRRHLLTFTNNTDITLDRVTLNDCGSKTPVSLPGQCQYDGGYAVWMPRTNSGNILFRDVNISNAEWTGYLLEPSAKILGGSITNVREAGIFGGSLGPNEVLIDGLTVDGVTRKDCSGQGMEISGTGMTIVNSTFKNIDVSGLWFFAPRKLIVQGCRFESCNQLETDSAHLTLYSAPQEAVPQLGTRIRIADNTFISEDGHGVHAVAALNYGGGAFDQVQIISNQWGDVSMWRGGPLRADGNVKGKNFIVSGNF